jgi:hypothetical protein
MQIDVVCFSLGNKSLPHQTVHFFEDALYTVFQDKYFLYHLQCILTFVDMLLLFTGVRSCYDEGKRVAETLMFDYHRQHGIGM